MYKLLMIMFFLCPSLRGEMFLFPIGEQPPISLRAAIDIFEKHAKKITGSDFNPRSAELVGSRNNGEGSWQLIQSDKNGRIYRYILYFPKNVCVIVSESDGQKFLGAFTKEGKILSKKDADWVDRKEISDPFSSPK